MNVLETQLRAIEEEMAGDENLKLKLQEESKWLQEEKKSNDNGIVEKKKIRDTFNDDNDKKRNDKKKLDAEKNEIASKKA